MAASNATHTKSPERIQIALTGYWQSTPDLHAQIQTGAKRRLPPSFADHFENYDEALAYLTNQSGALSILDKSVLYSKIDIPIATADVQPAELEFAKGELLDDLIDDAECFAFIVPSVPFQALEERLLPNKKDS